MNRYIHIVWISFFIPLFFILCIRCRQAESPPSVEIISNDDKAAGLIIHGINDLSKRLQIQLVQPGERIPVLGEFTKEGGTIIFEPLVPLSQGLRYEVLYDNLLFAEIQIPKGKFKAPELVSIYPTQDTLPENLLKVYLRFSEPMVEGRSLSNVTLIQNGTDTLNNTFLDLQPELWNAEGTVLTLWLDPGRIKRDLIPNKELGAPLQAAQQYTLRVEDSWKSKNGLSMSKNYTKTFVTTSRDEDSPNVVEWTVIPPISGTKQALEVQFHESLDYYLLKEVLDIVDSDGDFVSGVVEVSDEEQSFRFLPEKYWTAGTHTIQIEARLEDLAGNNLNRPFDRDVNSSTQEKGQEIFIKEFEIR